MRFRSVVRRPLRTAFGDRPVRRVVHGVELAMPWSHRLPDCVRRDQLYGQNLVRLARILADDGTDMLQVIDVGANIGDSARLILAEMNARILCVEGDRYWLPWLRGNVAAHPGVVVEPSLVVPRGWGTQVMARRAQGTTSFVPAAQSAADGPAAVTAAELRTRHPDFDRVRLIKTDTDGFDTSILPDLAAEYAHPAPVLFFEYDPAMTRNVGADPRPQDVWLALGRLGYARFVYWSNRGEYLGHADAAGIAERARDLELPLRVRRHQYWDVAAFRSEDSNTAEKVIRASTPRVPGGDRPRALAADGPARLLT